jgi:hypothetical protein
MSYMSKILAVLFLNLIIFCVLHAEDRVVVTEFVYGEC